MAATQKKIGFLTNQGTNKVPMPTDQDTWPQYAGMKGSFWSAVSAFTLGLLLLLIAWEEMTKKFIEPACGES